MNKISRPVFYTIVTLVVLALIGVVLASGAFNLGHGPTFMFFDDDLSDSALGWMIAIPVMVLVGVIVTGVMVGVAVVTAMALAFAAVMVVLVLVMTVAPIVVFLALPFLAIYGLVKLFQRDHRQLARLSQTMPHSTPQSAAQ